MVQSKRFPVVVLRYRLGTYWVDLLRKVSSHYLKHELSSWDYSKSLAGRIERGAQVELPSPTIDAPFWEERKKLFDLLQQLGTTYLQLAPPLEVAKLFWLSNPLAVDDVWCVSQMPGDSNPLHGHDGLLSGVLYLESPWSLGTVKDGAGLLTFVHSNPFEESLNPGLALGRLLDFTENAELTGPKPPPELTRVLPVVGDCWIFPSWLLHKVEPFAGDSERRSVAFNLKKAVDLPTRVTNYTSEPEIQLCESQFTRFLLFAQPSSNPTFVNA